MDCYVNGTYQLVDLDGTPRTSGVNRLRMKIYHTRLMVVVKDGELDNDADSLKNVATFNEEGLKSLSVAIDHE